MRRISVWVLLLCLLPSVGLGAAFEGANRLTTPSQQMKGTWYPDTSASLTNHAATTTGTLKYCSNQIGSSAGTIEAPPATYAVTGNLTLGDGTAKNLVYRPQRGAILSHGSNTVTIHGTIDAGPWQIFSGTGAVSVTGPLPQVYPEWFGAKADDSTDNAAAFLAAHTLAVAAKCPLVLHGGTYRTSDELLVTTSGVKILGEAVTSSALATGTWIKSTATDKDIIRISDATDAIDGFALENVNLFGNADDAGATAGSGLKIEASNGHAISNIRLRNVSIRKCKEYGLHVKADGAGNFVFKLDIENLSTGYNGKNGVLFEGAVSQANIPGLWTDYNALDQAWFKGLSTAASGMENITLIRPTFANAPAGYAGLRRTLCRGVNVWDGWWESNEGREVTDESVRYSMIRGGQIRQAGASLGIVISDNGAANQNLYNDYDIPGWINTSGNAFFKLNHVASSSQHIYFGRTSSGPITLSDIDGGAAYGLREDFYFWPEQRVTKSMNLLPYYVVGSGTWTASNATFRMQLARTSANSTIENVLFQVPLSSFAARTGWRKGIYPTAVVVVYEVTGANAGDDIQPSVYRWLAPADGAASPAVTTIAGASYDAAHDTAAKRVNSGGAGHQHNTLTFTLTPDWIDYGADQFLTVQITVTEADNAANALAVTLKGVFLRYTEAAF
jgi:hypothetical protein